MTSIFSTPNDDDDKVYDQCHLCRTTFCGRRHKKIVLYRHMRTEHRQMFAVEWEKILWLQDTFKIIGPCVSLQELRDELLLYDSALDFGQFCRNKIKLYTSSNASNVGGKSTARKKHKSKAVQVESTNSSNPLPSKEKDSKDDDMVNEFESKIRNYNLNKSCLIFQLRRNSVEVDVHLLARKSTNETFVVVPCHKIFLRTCPYFSARLDGAPQNGQIVKIDLDLDPEILEEILRYIYTGEMNVDSNNLVQLFEALHKMELIDRELMVKLSKFKIAPLINDANVLTLLRIFSSSSSRSTISDSCGKYLKDIFSFLREKSAEFMSWPSFLQLTFDEIRLLLAAESRVFKNAKDFQTSLLIWMAHDPFSKVHLINEISNFTFVELPEVIDLVEIEIAATSTKRNKNKNESAASNSEEDQDYISTTTRNESPEPVSKKFKDRQRLTNFLLEEEVNEYKEILTCPSCKVKRKDSVLLKCFHVFCYDCLTTLYVKRKRKCPKCSVVFGKKDYHRLNIS